MTQAAAEPKTPAAEGSTDLATLDSKAVVETRYLPVKLTDGRKLELGEELASNEVERERLLGVFEDLKKQHKANLSIREEKITVLSKTINQGFEMQPVKVSTWSDLQKNMLFVKRLDTNEIIQQRPLTAAEREQLLKPDKPAPAGNGKKA